MNLAGTWEFLLDPDDSGIAGRWFDGSLPDQVTLPGSLDENLIGEPNLEMHDLSGLSRKVHYVGPAWYSREILLPNEWGDQSLELTLERVHWFSDLWVDGVHIGRRDSLSVPHRYDIPLTTGSTSIRLTLRIDNTPHIPIGRIGHALTDWTQTNWNGIIGDISLETTASANQEIWVWTDDEGVNIEGTAHEDGTLRSQLAEQPPIGVHVDKGVAFKLTHRFGGESCWSDETPNLHEFTIELNGQVLSYQVGRRSIRTTRKEVLFNESPIFLRGTLECCVFPKTGFPPTTLHEWRRVMEQARAFGLNHIRFHSWCPPEAAFVAADQSGILLQVELPVWTGLWAISSDEKLMDFCRCEAHRILKEYGHHPSFVLFALGNEIAFYGSEPAVDALLDELRMAYPNRLYTFSAQGTHLSSACDYYVQADNGKPGEENKPLRGSTWFGVGSRFDRERPNTLVTCDEAADQFDKPVISHEVAEWAVFPDVHHADRYDGVLEARNFTTIAEMLAARGMLGQVADFVHASGKLSALLYKEEIETLLRTRGISGYQLLGLTDFPGQGTATIGMLDAFWEEKGFINAKSFRSFCNKTVPLLEVEKAVWLSDEQFTAKTLVFHSGNPESVELHWCLRDLNGKTLMEGSLGKRSLILSGATQFDELTFSWVDFDAPSRYTVELHTDAGSVNSWSTWVYPRSNPPLTLQDTFVAQFYRQDVREALSQGRDVWLKINPNKIWSGIPGRFAPAFWSPIHFKEQVGSMGTLIDSGHPIFSEFPTDAHTDWQWWDILTHSKAMNLNDLPLDFRPTLQVIDRYERNDKLGTIFEARVGIGRLFVTLIDFEQLEDRPASQQLVHSILKYLGSGAFKPTSELTLRHLDVAFRREP